VRDAPPDLSAGRDTVRCDNQKVWHEDPRKVAEQGAHPAPESVPSSHDRAQRDYRFWRPRYPSLQIGVSRPQASARSRNEQGFSTPSSPTITPPRMRYGARPPNMPSSKYGKSGTHPDLSCWTLRQSIICEQNTARSFITPPHFRNFTVLCARRRCTTARG